VGEQAKTIRADDKGHRGMGRRESRRAAV